MLNHEAVSWKYLIIPAFLALSTTILSYIAVFNPDLFYSAMDMSTPEDNFMTLSWAARNTAVAVALWVVILGFRTLQALLVALSAHFAVGILDLFVNFQTNMSVNIMAWVILGLEIFMFVLLFRLMAERNRESRRKYENQNSN